MKSKQWLYCGCSTVGAGEPGGRHTAYRTGDTGDTWHGCRQQIAGSKDAPGTPGRGTHHHGSRDSRLSPHHHHAGDGMQARETRDYAPWHRHAMTPRWLFHTQSLFQTFITIHREPFTMQSREDAPEVFTSDNFKCQCWPFDVTHNRSRGIGVDVFRTRFIHSRHRQDT